MKELILSIGRTFLRKNIAFSIYRFPNTQEWSLAVDSRYLPHQPKRFFWMTPFRSESSSPEIIYAVVDKPFINKSWLAQAKSLPEQKKINISLSPKMTKDVYFKIIYNFLKEIKKEKLRKAILSRVYYESKPASFDPVDGLSTLAMNNPKALVYLSLHPDAGLWMGATPELLIKSEKKRVHTMALAGTRKKRKDHHYSWRTKEKEEHAMVGQHIEAVFAKERAMLIQKKGPKSIETDSVAHLQTEYTFKRNSKRSLTRLLKDLHPTPAVAGLPVEESLECILQNEGYDRKYYSGIIGETNFHREAQLYINLRCMQIGDKKAAIYVGGGITAASDPEEEWEETVLKGQSMSKLIHSKKTQSTNDLIR